MRQAASGQIPRPEWRESSTDSQKSGARGGSKNVIRSVCDQIVCEKSFKYLMDAKRSLTVGLPHLYHDVDPKNFPHRQIYQAPDTKNIEHFGMYHGIDT